MDTILALKQPLGKGSIVGPVREALLDALWEEARSSPRCLKTDMSPYLEYYSRRVQRFLLDGSGPQCCLRNHSDLVLIAKELLSRQTRDDIYQVLRQRLGQAPSADDINHAIDLCASLLAMVEIELSDSRVGLTTCTTIYWNENSLSSALHDYFRPQTDLHADHSKLGKLFTARNLVRISGIRIKWTSNLADHLRLVDDDQAVLIFQCASFLQFQDSLIDNLFPDFFLRETLNTLALLFPSTDRETRQWLQSQPSIDAKLDRCGTLRTSERRLEKFSFWHDRLVILKQAFDESHPKTLSQWWFDRRNGVQWYTFWVAILVFVVTVFFGVLQSVTGVMQVYFAYKAVCQS